MNNLKILASLLLLTLLISCKKDDDPTLESGDYLIFGHYYGECFGEACMETYKLTDSRLYEDILDMYGGSGPFDFVELPDAEYQQVKDLIDAFPPELLKDDTGTFGCPDCADGGGLYIEYSHKGEARSWRIDQVKEQVPQYLHGFMDAVNGKILLID
jgi:hypothetical protein